MTNADLFLEHTPIEPYRVGDSVIYVKRDDMYGRPPAPPLAKLRGLRLLLAKLHAGGTRLVGCWDTRISKLGLGLAAAVRAFEDMRCVVSYPTKKGVNEPAHVTEAARLGAEIYPVPGGRINVSFSKARRHVESMGGVMLPFGLECREAVDGVREEAARTPAELLQGTLVSCCGSGVTLAGLISGLPILPRRIVGISSGRSVANIMACLKRYAAPPPGLEIHEAQTSYSAAESFPCPFPSHPNYDLKAWKFLVTNRHAFPEPLLFWNIGA